jgi:type I restriction enzyme, S subunit
MGIEVHGIRPGDGLGAYKETVIGIIPKDWDTTKLGDQVEDLIVPMRDKPKQFNGEIPWCRIDDFNGKYLYTSKNGRFVDEDTILKMNLKVFPKGTVICSCSAKLGICAIAGNPLITNQTFIGIVPKTFDKEFLYYLMKSYAKRLQSLSTGTTISYLPKDKFENFIIAKPPLNEQRKIAVILSTVDAAIEQTDAIIAQTERMKKSLMQELLTKGIGHKAYRDTPIGRIPIEWDVMTCDSVCEEIVVGIVVKPSQYYSSSGVPALRSANIREGGIDPSNLVFITEESNRMLAKSMVRSGNVLTVRTGYPGTSCVVPPEFDGCNCIDIIISRPKPEIISSFLSTWINSDFGKKQVLRVQSGLAQQHFNIGELKKMLIAKPSVEEQQRIMSIINVHDLRLCLEDSYLSKLKQLKRGLMQDLLTGKVRVKVDGHA